MDDQEVFLISSDSDSSILNACSLSNEHDIQTNIQKKQIPQTIFESLSNKNENDNAKILTKQRRLAHVLSESEDSDSSFVNGRLQQYCIAQRLSDNESISTKVRARAKILKYNGNCDIFSTDLLYEDNQKWQDMDEVVVDSNFPEKKKRKTTKKSNCHTKDKEDRLRKKEDEAKKRAERQAALKLQRQLKPGECIKYMKVVLDSALLACPFGGELLTTVQNMECEYQLDAQSVPLSITWLRKLPDSNPVEEAPMLLVWQWEQFVQSVHDRTLCDDVKSIQKKMAGKIVTLVVYSIDGYFSYLKKKRRKSQTSSKRQKDTAFDTMRTVSRGDMELALTELQIQANCSHRLINTAQELGLLVSQYTKSVAEIPFKKEKQKREQDHLDWFAVGDSRDCVRIDKEGNGLLRLWQQQLCQFNLAGIDTAQAIAAVYQSPQLLIQAYDKCETQKEGELLLQDITIRRSQGPLAPTRRIGPELSKKIYMFFNNVDGDSVLSQ